MAKKYFKMKLDFSSSSSSSVRNITNLSVHQHGIFGGSSLHSSDSVPLDLSIKHSVINPHTLTDFFIHSDSNPITSRLHPCSPACSSTNRESLNRVTGVSTMPTASVAVSGPLNEGERLLGASSRASSSRNFKAESGVNEQQHEREQAPIHTAERRKRRNAQAKRIRDARKHRRFQLESEIRYLEIRNLALHSRIRRLIQEKTAYQNAILRHRLTARLPH